MIRVIALIGTRPEAVEMAARVRVLRSKQDGSRCCIVSSDWHR